MTAWLTMLLDSASRAVLLAAVMVGSAMACSSTAGNDAAEPSTTSTADAAPTTSATTLATEDVEAQADDFVHLADMTPVRRFFVDNLAGHLDEAVALAESGGAGTYPVGTVIQLIPQEAMVKRRAGFDPSSNDWEFFELDVSPAGTVIHQRGGGEIVNRFGSGSCAGCHALADPEFDFVCEDTHGCDPLPVSKELIDGLQQSDPRPRSS